MIPMIKLYLNDFVAPSAGTPLRNLTKYVSRFLFPLFTLSADLSLELEAEMNAIRSDDISGLKRATAGLISTTEKIFLDSHTKINRGFVNPHTGRLLCPVKYLDVFNQDPLAWVPISSRLPFTHHNVFLRFGEKGKGGAIHVGEDSFMVMMYDMELYDPENIERGLLQGFLLVRASNLFFSHTPY